MFPNLKIWLDGNKFLSNKAAIEDVNEHLVGFDKIYFFDGINNWQLAGLSV